MRIVAVRESEGEPRAAITPETVRKLRALAAPRRRPADANGDTAAPIPTPPPPPPPVDVAVEAGIGAAAHFADAAYAEAGAEVLADREALLRSADVVLRVGRPTPAEVALYREGAAHVGFVDPFNDRELLGALERHGVTSVSMELMPRTTKAQPMDALSSQHSIGGYAMVILAAQRFGRVFPMMVTPSGTLQPARVLVIGAGVAGLQAIATARRLGARVEAFDTRPDTREQVRSLGARFVEIDLGETGQTAGGYARELTEEQKARQREGLKKAVTQADIVITTAALFGRPAPRIVFADMLAGMKPGSVVVDYAAASGGNVEGSAEIVARGEEEGIVADGVRLIAMRNYAGLVPTDASAMYAANLFAFVKEFYDAERGVLELDREGDAILAGCVLTRGGRVVNQTVLERLHLA